MLDKNNLSIQKVGENEFVIRNVYRDNEGRRHTQFLAHIANSTTDNEKTAQWFIDGIGALQEREAVEHTLAEGRACTCPFPEWSLVDGVPVVCLGCGEPPASKA